MVNSPLIRPYFLGWGGIGGVPLDSPDKCLVHSEKRTAISPLKIGPAPFWEFIFQPLMFRGYVGFREGTYLTNQ